MDIIKLDSTKIESLNYKAEKYQLRSLRLFLNNPSFTTQHSFINKKDVNDFLDFIVKFIDQNYLADIEYLSREIIKLGSNGHKSLTVNFYQPNTTRIIYSETIDGDDRMELRTKVANDLKLIDMTDFKGFIETIREVFEEDTRWN